MEEPGRSSLENDVKGETEEGRERKKDSSGMVETEHDIYKGVVALYSREAPLWRIL